MTAWGVVAVCAIGGGVAGPFVEQVARRVPVRPRPRAGPVVAGGTAEPGAMAEPGVAASAGAAGAVSPGAAAPAAAADPGGAPEASLRTVAVTVAAAAAADPPGRPAARSASVPEVAAVAVVTAASFALAAARLGAVPSLAAFCALFGGLVAVSVVDLHVGLVPRRILYPTLGLVAAGLVAASADSGTWRPLLDAVVGGAVAFVVFYAIWWIYPKGLGFGDVRLAGLCGLGLGFLGFRQLYIGFLAAFLLGALGGVVALARRGSHRFPFAPALAAGTVFGVLWGGWLGNLWLHPG